MLIMPMKQAVAEKPRDAACYLEIWLIGMVNMVIGLVESILVPTLSYAKFSCDHGA